MANAKTADASYASGTQALRDGRYSDAEQAFRQAVSANPTHANALYRLGEFSQGRGDIGAAVDLYRRTLDAHPGHRGAIDRLAELALKPPPPSPVPAPIPGPGAGDEPAKTELAIKPTGKSVFGVVSAASTRVEYDQLTKTPLQVLSVRLDRRDRHGDGASIGITMKGLSIGGNLQKGDWIELPPDWRPGRAVRAVLNLTTGERVDVPQQNNALYKLAVVLLILIAVFVLFGLLKAFRIF